jgi:hypothetical protein
MATIKHYINTPKADRLIVWLITALLATAGFSWLKSFIVLILLKVYELFIQHAAGR